MGLGLRWHGHVPWIERISCVEIIAMILWVSGECKLLRGPGLGLRTPANEVQHGWAGFVETSTGEGRIKRPDVHCGVWGS